MVDEKCPSDFSFAGWVLAMISQFGFEHFSLSIHYRNVAFGEIPPPRGRWKAPEW